MTHPDQYAAYNQTYRQKQIERIKCWYESFKKTMKCTRCPETHQACLQFHHIDPETKRFEVKQAMRKGCYPLETILQEIKKCVILCANCHCKHHWEERHKTN